MGQQALWHPLHQLGVPAAACNSAAGTPAQVLHPIRLDPRRQMSRNWYEYMTDTSTSAPSGLANLCSVFLRPTAPAKPQELQLGSIHPTCHPNPRAELPLPMDPTYAQTIGTYPYSTPILSVAIGIHRISSSADLQKEIERVSRSF